MGAFERWRAIPNYEGLYEVSDRGRVRSVDHVLRNSRGELRRYSSHILAEHRRGYAGAYRGVDLWKNNRRTTHAIHTLVLTAFVGPPPFKGAQAAHGPDPDPSNNRLDNLRWHGHVANGNERDARRYGGLSGAESIVLVELEGALADDEGADDGFGAVEIEEEAPF